MESSQQNKPERAKWRDIARVVIFGTDTLAGKVFDIALIVCILASILVVMLESVDAIKVAVGPWLIKLEWFFTILFTIEYIMRLLSVRRPARYAFSFFGLVDLMAILPTYLSLFFAHGHALMVIRILRVLRLFRVLKLAKYVSETTVLAKAMLASRRKITVFLFAILSVVVIMGSLMYLLESGENSGFTSIPKSVYWAIVTLTTVGYGDISPDTALGQFFAAILMIMGYAIIAVPTGIMTVELTKAAANQPVSTRACPDCATEIHDIDAKFCKFCGAAL